MALEIMTHALKTWPQYWKAIANGTKTFEVRKNDRNFQVGEKLILQEFDPKEGYSGGEIEREISFILEGGQFGIKKGYCVIGLKERPDWA